MKKLTFLLFLISISTIAFGQEFYESTTQTITRSGIGLGSVIAIVASWDRNKSILWAILHGILGWLYVIYFVITRNSYDKQGRDKQQSHLFKIDYEEYENDKNKE